jgi:hypothetical protein
MVVSQAVYLPWSREPLDILDFSEFLLQMRTDATVLENWWRLARYYAGHGRVNEVPYGLIALTYGWFELEPLGWQALRAVQMMMLPLGAYVVLRRFGGTRFGSALGASLFFFGSVAASNWLRQTAEPVATLFFLGAAGLACGFSHTANLRWRVAGFGACVVGMVLSKETMVACIPFLVLTASCWQTDGAVRPFRLDRRTIQALTACGVAVAVLAVLLIWAFGTRQSHAYAGLYGSASIAGNVSVLRVLPLILPVTLATPDVVQLLLFPANLVFVGALSAAFLGSFQWRTPGDLHRKLLIASTLPAGGLLVYLPWPRFELFYGLPFLLGVSLWVAVLFDRPNERWRVALSVAWVFMLVLTAVSAAGLARYTRARRQVNAAVALDLSKRKPTDTVAVASARLTPQPWQNPAATLGRYAVATRVAQTMPELIDVTCDMVATPATRWQTGSRLYVYVEWCGVVGPAMLRIEEQFSFFDWASLDLETAAYSVDVFDRP